LQDFSDKITPNVKIFGSVDRFNFNLGRSTRAGAWRTRQPLDTPRLGGRRGGRSGRNFAALVICVSARLPLELAPHVKRRNDEDCGKDRQFGLANGENRLNCIRTRVRRASRRIHFEAVQPIRNHSGVGSFDLAGRR
jgi:hypothetical protein